MNSIDFICDRNENRTDEPELLPCPFCDGKAEQIENIDDSSVTHYVECTNCKNSTGIYGTKVESANAWNRRVPAAGQWTKKPTDNGLYVVKVRGYGVFKLTVVEAKGGCIKDHHGSTYSKEDFCKMAGLVLWCKLAVPPLPEGKESNE